MDNTDDILKQINSVNWFQKFEILPGIFTPGKKPVNAQRFLNKLKIPNDLTGLKVLDIGTWDGATSFEFERRGAQTFAIDIQNPDYSGFNIAKKILHSNVEYIKGSVYDLEKFYGKKVFDIVCFKGVYYHLKNPIQAFEEISSVVKDQGSVLIAGELIVSYAQTLEGDPVFIDDVKKLADSKIPLTICYPGSLKNMPSTCWFIPNLACIKSWLEVSGLKLQHYEIVQNLDAKPKPLQRFVGKAIKIGDKFVIEHGVMPPKQN